MKNRKFQYISFSVVALSIMVGCASPKVLESKTVSPLPDRFVGDSLAHTEEFIPIKLSTYFQDPKLMAIFDKIVASNMDFKILEQRVLIANSHLKRARLAMLPTLDINLSGSGTRFGDHTMEGVGNFDTNLSPNITEDQKINREVTPNLWLGASTSWEADIWGRLRNQKKAAKNRYLASHEGMRLMQNHLFTEVAELYYQLISLDKKLKVYNENAIVQQRAYEIILAQRAAGKSTELAVQQFGAQSKNLLAETERLKVEIAATEKALSSLMGEYSAKIERGDSFMTNHLTILNQNMHVDSIIHNRPDVAESYFEFQATNGDARSARAAFFPKLQINAYGALNSFSGATFFNVGSFAWQILGGLTQPIFQQGKLRQDLYVANRQQEIAFYGYQKNVINAFNELSLLLYQVDAYNKMVVIKGEEVAFLERAVEVANDLYLTGYANYLEIINAQQTRIKAEIDYVDYQQYNVKAQIQLFKALGGEMK